MFIKNTMFFAALCALLLLTAACAAGIEEAYEEIEMGVATEWTDFIRWSGQSYENCSMVVPLDLIGEKISSVTKKSADRHIKL